MTTPRRPTPPPNFMGSGRRRPQPEAAPEPYSDPEIVRGLADSVLGALGRMDQRLDDMAKAQAEMLGKVLEALERVDASLSGIEFVDDVPPAPDAREQPADDSSAAIGPTIVGNDWRHGLTPDSP